MTQHEYTVILVLSTHYAIRIEKLLVKTGIPCRLIPIPRHLSSDCGVCVRINQKDRKRVLRDIEACRFGIESIQNI